MPLATAAVVTAAAVALGSVVIFRKRRPMATEEIPAKMRRVVLVEANKNLWEAKLEVQEVDTPRPRPGQVLVKMEAAPINPSDDGVWRVKPAFGYPIPLGNEGSGTVIASGGGFFAGRLLGQNVVLIGGGPKYAEYAVADAFTETLTLPSHVPVEDGCAFFINPFTVVGIVETVTSRGDKVFIHTAAASQLGRMMVKYCKLVGVTLVNVVRREEQAVALRDLGADYVVVTGSGEEWKDELQKLIKDLQIKYAFDAVAGNMTGTLLTMLPKRGCVWVYGRLSPEPVGNIEPLDLIYRGKTVQGFLLTDWVLQGGPLRALMRVSRTAASVGRHWQAFKSEFKDTAMTSMHADYCASLEQGISGTKMRVRFRAA